MSLPEPLASWVATVASEHGPVNAAVIATVHGHDTTLHHLRLTFEGKSEDLWFKRYRSQVGHAWKEWTFLKRRAPSGSIDLAEPVAFIDSSPCVVTRHAPGTPLSSSLDAGAEAEAACARIGSWLAALHADALDGETHPREAIAAGVRQRAGHGAPAALQQVQSAVKALLAAASDKELVRVRTHGDFAPFNIILDDGRGAVIDPSFERSIDDLDNYCARYEDISRFLTALDDEHHSQRPLMAAFMRGYGATTPIAPAPLTAFLAKYGLQALLDHWTGRTEWAQRAGLAGMLRGWTELAEAMARAAGG
jgi:aminoglycoside phosphotransferase (APT) family kinase protein